MVTEADWTNWKPADLRPYIDLALECFGPERCMYGSDWPVCELAGSYADVHAAAQECLSKLSPHGAGSGVWWNSTEILWTDRKALGLSIGCW